jgi:hypothetical protein
MQGNPEWFYSEENHIDFYANTAKFSIAIGWLLA